MLNVLGEEKRYQHLFSPCPPKNNKFKLAYLNKDTFIELIRKKKQLSRNTEANRSA